MLTPAALLPPDEADRLRSLRHYDFAADQPDEAFHDLVALAALAFDVSMSFIALVDAHEVRFPVTHGVPQTLSLPRAQALCSSAILHPGAMAYQNLGATDQTGSDGPAIRSALALGSSFYAAAPLRMPDSRIIGVLCLVGPQPRPFAPEEEDVLEAIADLTSCALAVRHLCRSTPELGTDEWQFVHSRLLQDVQELRAVLQMLLAEHGTHTPASPAVLRPLQQRLQALRLVLAD